ncbi:hypothetical protein FH972_001009 [Carpinus fangiana]|uniref:Uncharacterized protein n=1 Tax=Carpinus fangiana TaxID=176857 RepID=A0A5N6QAS1_9ROSI|nr:hypothetical protein FH972_001009 [Carpinus fangiana]
MASEDSTDCSSPGVSLLKEDDYEVIVNNLIDDYFGVPREEEKADNENEKKTASLDPVLEKVASTSNDDLQMISAGVTRRETEEFQESRTESTSEVNVNQLKKDSEANLTDDYQKYCRVAQKDPNDPFLESKDCSPPDVRQLTEEVCKVIVNSLIDDFRTYFRSMRPSMASEDSTDGSSPDVGQLTEENNEVIDDFFEVPREEEKAENENGKKTASLDPVLEEVASTSNDDLQKISAGVTRRETEELQESRTESTSEVNVNQLKKESEANLIAGSDNNYLAPPLMASEDPMSRVLSDLMSELEEAFMKAITERKKNEENEKSVTIVGCNEEKREGAESGVSVAGNDHGGFKNEEKKADNENEKEELQVEKVEDQSRRITTDDDSSAENCN